MASASFVSDFGRRPVGFKVGVFVVIGLVLGALYYQFVFSGLRKDTEEAEQTKAALQGQEVQLKKDEKEHAELSKKRDELKRIITENENALPTAAQLPAFFDMLNQKVGEAGVEVREWSYLREIAVEDFYKVPVQIEIQGSFYEIKKFFYLLYKMSQKESSEAGAPAPGAPVSVAERDRILTIESLELMNPVVVNNELLLRAKFQASTFRKEAVEENPLEEKGKPKAKDPKAKPAPPPAPTPGGKPGEVKEKVDAAMEKVEKEREERVRSSQEPPLETLLPKPDPGADRVKGGI